jgi:hypothetical protein
MNTKNLLRQVTPAKLALVVSTFTIPQGILPFPLPVRRLLSLQEHSADMRFK